MGRNVLDQDSERRLRRWRASLNSSRTLRASQAREQQEYYSHRLPPSQRSSQWFASLDARSGIEIEKDVVPAFFRKPWQIASASPLFALE